MRIMFFLSLLFVAWFMGGVALLGIMMALTAGIAIIQMVKNKDAVDRFQHRMDILGARQAKR